MNRTYFTGFHFLADRRRTITGVSGHGSVSMRAVTIWAVTVGPVTMRAVTVGPVTMRAVTVGPVTMRAVAVGAVTMRAVAVGAVSIGTVAAGAFAAGAVAIGTVTAGAFAMKAVAIGAVAAGAFVIGAVTAGTFAVRAFTVGTTAAVGGGFTVLLLENRRATDVFVAFFTLTCYGFFSDRSLRNDGTTCRDQYRNGQMNEFHRKFLLFCFPTDRRTPKTCSVRFIGFPSYLI